MKMQNYIRFVLSLLLIVSNLSVAFSMHFCQGQVENVKLNHFDNKICKMQMPTSCCAEKKETKHCEIPEEKPEKDDDCCKDIAYADDLQDQQTVDVLKVNPIVFQEFPVVKEIEFSVKDSVITFQKYLDFYVESNAPPIYILHKKLVFYEI
ncbi:HYC_CC_PP family protein [Faecalibacter bovis]|uniref:Uncharacterized protein n=1 Tax=Faecalibacter bovis TaxID=2898187 RepID=A0ABX7XDE8_9FLAO|nr:hypothetical protein [Faecalibacter bovis]MBS7334303.1 hypothetical protein [Weeksellaceae bacterium]QTV05858.1 hypothetical protein J9309_00450 [Faecalibacter bovis]